MAEAFDPFAGMLNPFDSSDEPGKWTHDQAVELCQKVEAICPKFGYHVALTGGCLYKAHLGPRKDCDLVFYRIRQVEEPDTDGMFEALKEQLEIERVSVHYAWVHKATYLGRNIDCLFPERTAGPEHSGEQDYPT